MDETYARWESVKFAVGLSGITSIFTQHLLQLFVDDEIEYMKGKVVNTRHGCWTGDLRPLASCAKEIPSEASDLFCNTHISFATRVPWQMRSKLYFFAPMQDDLHGLSEGGRNFEIETSETCSIIIWSHPCIGLVDTLKTVSDLDQPITNLFLHPCQYENDDPVVIENPVFTLDPEARCVSISWPKMPMIEQKSLANQLSRCRCIETLSIPGLTSIASCPQTRKFPTSSSFRFGLL